MTFLWEILLYNPILNVLIWFYNGLASQNLGLALIELTIALRIVLIPFSIVGIRARTRFAHLQDEMHNLGKAYKDDPVMQKEATRHLLKQHHINPWPKAVVLGMQVLVIIILYYVFIGAVGSNDFSGLYAWNLAPDFLRTEFLGFDLAARSAIWSGAVGILLYFELWSIQRRDKHTLVNSDVLFRVAFPLASFLVLYWLPMGKTVFVLTSIAFTLIIEGIGKLIFRRKRPPSIMGGGLERINHNRPNGGF